MAKHGEFSDDTVIGWRLDRLGMGLYKKQVGNYPLIRLLGFEDTRVMIFPEPVDMAIPAQYLDNEIDLTTLENMHNMNMLYRPIVVQGNAFDVFSKIFFEYQKPATKEEIQIANEKGQGSKGPRLIDQMGDMINYGGWSAPGECLLPFIRFEPENIPSYKQHTYVRLCLFAN